MAQGIELGGTNGATLANPSITSRAPMVRLRWLTPSVLFMGTYLLSIASFNVLSLAGTARQEEVIRAFSKHDIIILQGTRERTAGHAEMDNCCGYFKFKFGYGPKSNKHAGCAIYFKKGVFHTSGFKAVAYPDDAQLLGRLGAVRYKDRANSTDINIVAAYLPPEGAKGTRKIYEKAVNWLHHHLDRLPHRVLPVVGTDANCKLGMQVQDGIHVSTASGSVGQCQPDLEGSNSIVFRSLIERHHLKAVNTFVEAGPTYWSATSKSKSRIDYVLVPVSAEHKVKKVFVDVDLGDRVQLIRSCHRADHRPIVCKLECRLEYSGSSTHCTWDMNRIAAARLKGKGKADFVEQVEATLRGHAAYLEASIAASDMHSLWNTVSETVGHVASSHFALSARPQTESKERQQKKEALAELMRIRSNTQLSEGATFVHVSVYAQWCSVGASLNRDFMRSTLRTWHVVAKLFKSCKRLKQAARRLKAEERRCLEQAIAEEWERRNSAACWRLARLLSATKVGPKKRVYNLASRYLPSREEWSDAVKATGPNGGYAAEIVHDMSSGPCPSMNRRGATATYLHIREAEKLLDKVSWELHRMPNRKQPPEWDSPTEVWDMLMMPRWTLFQDRQGISEGMSKLPQNSEEIANMGSEWAGMGLVHPLLRCDRYTKDNSVFQHVMTNLYAMSLANMQLPWQFNCSHAFHIPKCSTVEGVKARRMLHSFPPIAKATMKVVIAPLGAQHPPTWAFGCVAKKTREEAIMSQLILGHRVRECDLSSAMKLYDITNAFPSASRAKVSEACTRHPSYIHDKFLQDHHRLACSVMNIDGDKMCFVPGSGILAGSSAASDMFNRTFWNSTITPWIGECRDIDSSLVAKSVLSGEKIDLATTVFVDDVARRVVAENFSELVSKSTAVTQKLREKAEDTGLALNSSKLESVITLKGAHTRAAKNYVANRAASLEGVFGSIRRESRYLGPVIHHLSSFRPERERRISAANTAFYTMGKFWRSSSP